MMVIYRPGTVDDSFAVFQVFNATIMDYGERETPTGVVPRVATVLGAVTVVSGVWMLYFSFWRPRTVRR